MVNGTSWSAFVTFIISVSPDRASIVGPGKRPVVCQLACDADEEV